MTWDYAELSAAAKANGGPEKFVEALEKASKAAGRAEGQTEMIPWFVVAVASATALTLAAVKVVSHLKKKKNISQLEADIAKTEIIRGIREYDDAHPNREATSTEDEEML